MIDAAAAQEQQQQPGPAGQQQLAVKASRSVTWRSKLRVCQALEPKRITFGKSGIHGWGIFARSDIPADTMVTEFRGQLIRGIMADVREAAYRKQVRVVRAGGGCCVVLYGVLQVGAFRPQVCIVQMLAFSHF